MEQKGFTTLLQALEMLHREGSPRPFHLVAIESGDHRRRSEREIAARNLADCVTVLDFMPDVLPVLRQLDLLVVPSLWEASSLLSMEAMCVGVPVLGSDCIGLRQVLHGTPSRMFRAGDPVALAGALRQALPRPWSGQARAFAESARSRFDCRQYAEQFLTEFEQLYRQVERVRR
jgi:glycosyltransferase involved in cell wall biosynthesis